MRGPSVGRPRGWRREHGSVSCDSAPAGCSRQLRGASSHASADNARPATQLSIARMRWQTPTRIATRRRDRRSGRRNSGRDSTCHQATLPPASCADAYRSVEPRQPTAQRTSLTSRNFFLVRHGSIPVTIDRIKADFQKPCPRVLGLVPADQAVNIGNLLKTLGCAANRRRRSEVQRRLEACA